MNTPDVPESNSVPSAPNTVPKDVDTTTTVSAIQSLLSSESITDPVDKRIIGAAASFLESRTGSEDLADITKHASAVAEVMSGYDMQGQDVPAEIDAAYLELTIMQGRFHISTVKAELGQNSPDKKKMEGPMSLALDVAKVLAKGYKDDTLITEVQVLQTQINQL